MVLGSCKKCYWPIKQTDVYCSGCGTKLLACSLTPHSGTSMYVIENKSRMVVITNTGRTQLQIYAIRVFSPPDAQKCKGETVIDKILLPDSERQQPLNMDSYGFKQGDRGQVEIVTKPPLEDLKLAFEIIQSPPIVIKLFSDEFPESIFKDASVWYIDAVKGLINFKATIDAEYNPQIISCHLEGNKEKNLFVDDKIAVKHLPKQKKMFLIFRIEVAGAILEEKVEIETVQLPQPISNGDFNQKTHNCMIHFGDSVYKETSYELINGAGEHRFFALQYTYDFKQARIKVNSCNVNNTILFNNGEELPVSAEEQWLELKKDSQWEKALSGDGGTDKTGGVFNFRFYVHVKSLPSLRKYANKKNSIRFSTELIVNYSVVYQETELSRFIKERLNFVMYFHDDINIVMDFGTSNTCVAYLSEDDARIELLSLEKHQFDIPNYRDEYYYLDDDRELPSIFRLESFPDDYLLNTEGRITNKQIGTEQISVGEYVLDRQYAVTDDIILAATCSSFKTMLNADNDIPRSDIKGDHSYDFQPFELCSIFMNYIFSFIKETIPATVKNVYCTFPVSFTKKEKDGLKNAFIAAGIRRENISLEVPEPTGLAITYAKEHLLEEDGQSKVIAIFDCGGGTTDISIARYYREDGERNLRFLAGTGLSYLGGDYFDYLIAKKLAEKIKVKILKEIYFPDKYINMMNTQGDEQSNYSVLLEKAREIKEKRLDVLSEKGKLEITFTHQLYVRDGDPLVGHTVELTLDAFHEAVDTEITKGLETINQMGVALLANGALDTDIGMNIDESTSHSLAVVVARYDFNSQQLLFFVQEGRDRKEIHREEVTELTIPILYQIYYENIYIPNQLTYSEHFTSFEIVGIKKLSDGFEQRCREFGILRVSLVTESEEKMHLPFLDALIFGGNSCKMKRIRDIARQEVPVKGEYVYDPKKVKSSVVLGAADYYLEQERLPFNIEDVEISSFSLGFLRQGRFLPVLPQWLPYGERRISQKMKIKRPHLKGRRIYENRDPLNAANLEKKDSNGTPVLNVVGDIPIPQEWLGKYLSVEFFIKDGSYYYSRWLAEEKDEELILFDENAQKL